MQIRTVLFSIPLFLWGCDLSENSYKNKELYQVHVGETVEIYYSTNSCCFYCVSNEQDLKHVRRLQGRTVKPEPEDCDGCNHTAAFVFRAESIGTDTVELQFLEAGEVCGDIRTEPEQYIIQIQ